MCSCSYAGPRSAIQLIKQVANEYPPHEVQQQAAPAPQGMYVRMHAMQHSPISGYPVLAISRYAMSCHTTSYYNSPLSGSLVFPPNLN